MNRRILNFTPLWLAKFKYFEKYLPKILWLIAIQILYLPLLINGGIIIDDWGGIASNFQCNSIFDYCFIERYLDAFYAVFANRPLAPLPIVFSTILFKTNFTWYLYLNTTIFLSSILIAAWIINKIAGQISALIFSYVAIIPFIAMPLVVSPINLMDSTFAYLLWSISIYLLYCYCMKKSYLTYFISYLLLVGGFFTYEVFLPLLTMNALIPCIVDKTVLQKSKLKYFAQYITPLIIVLAVVYLWQKVIGPNYYHFHSRLSFGWDNVVPSFLSWANIFFYDAPQLFLKAWKFLSPYLLLSSIFFIISIALSCKILLRKIKRVELGFPTYFLISALCFLGSSFIFILSGAKAEIGGYEARALSSTWICFALFCSGLSTLFFKHWSLALKKVCITVCLGILFLCCLSFGIQRDNYIKSWKIQMYIIKDALSLISNNDLKKPSTVIGNVPQFLSKNYNNELIFNTYWDFTAALQVFTNRLVEGGPVIDAKSGNFHNLRIIDGQLSIDGLKINDFSNLWFYDFDQSIGKGSLLKVSSIQDLKKNLALLGNPTYLGVIGKESALERGEVLYFSQDWINRHHFIKYGFAERESWGVWSSGKEADLILPLPTNSATGLRLKVRAFVTPLNPVQKIQITVNDRQLEQVILSKSSGNEISIPLPPSDFSLEKTVKIHFKFLNAISPKDAKVGIDERVLAIGLETATFY